jgi:uncharacterized membrane protein
MLKTKIPKRTVLSRLRTYFLTGVVVLIPIGITVYLTVLIMSISPSLIPASINPNKYLPFNIPGLEFLIAFIIITFVGMVSLTFIGKTLLNFGQRILNKIPILRTIYNGLGQLTKNFTSSNNKSKKIVLLEYPRKGIWSVGFATGDNKGEISKKAGRGKQLINVFVPTTPNPTSGFLLMVPKKDLIFLDMNFEEASKFIMSAGSINPRSKQ